MPEKKIEKDSQKSYLIVTVGEKLNDTMEVKMLENNQIPGLLPMSCRMIDNQPHYYYSISGYRGFENYIKENKTDFCFLFNLFSEVIHVLEQSTEYFLCEDGFMLQPDWLFWNPIKNSIGICYVPGERQDFQKNVCTLMEFLMKQVDHKDKMAAEFIYYLYDFVQEESFVSEMIKVQMQLFENKNKAENRKKQQINENQNVSEKQKIIENEKNTKSQKIAESQGIAESQKIAKSQGIVKNQKITKFQKKEEKSGYYSLKPEISPKEMNFYTLVAKLEGLTWQKFILKEEQFSKKELLQGIQIGREECMWQIGYEQISRKHALLQMEGEELFLSDIGSLNGTFLNGKKVAKKVKVSCKVGDIITFANISYRLEYASTLINE